MSKITLIAVAALGLSAVFVLLLIWRSKEGHENEKCFHPGSDDTSPEAEAHDAPKVRPPDDISRESTASITAKK
jgi:hypothetical protein